MWLEAASETVSLNPLLKAMSSTAGFSMLCLVCIWIFLRMETAQLSKQPGPMFSHPLKKKKVNKYTFTCSFLYFNLRLQKSVLPLSTCKKSFYPHQFSPSQIFVHIHKIPPESAVVGAEQPQLSQHLLICQIL